jgi:hypothetical protein
VCTWDVLQPPQLIHTATTDTPEPLHMQQQQIEMATTNESDDETTAIALLRF